jgi:hypothetical protein
MPTTIADDHALTRRLTAVASLTENEDWPALSSTSLALYLDLIFSTNPQSPASDQFKETLNATLCDVAITHVASLLNGGQFEAVLAFVKNEMPGDDRRDAIKRELKDLRAYALYRLLKFGEAIVESSDDTEAGKHLKVSLERNPLQHSLPT